MIGPARRASTAQRCGVFGWRPPRRAGAGAQRRARRLGQAGAAVSAGERRAAERDPLEPRLRRCTPRACCASSTPPACSSPPTSTSPAALARARRRGRRDRRCWPRRSPCARRGSATCTSTWPRIRDTAAVDAEEPVDLAALPWPEPGAVDRARGAPARWWPTGDRTGRRGRARCGSIGTLAVPRPLLGRGGRGGRGAAGAMARRARRPASTSRALRRRPGAAVRRRRPARQRTGGGRRGARGASRWWPAAPAPARRPRWRGSWRCSASRRCRGTTAAADRAGGAHRQGGRPAARRPSTPRRPRSTSTPASARSC